jgi:RecA/RadA recombinase
MRGGCNACPYSFMDIPVPPPLKKKVRKQLQQIEETEQKVLAKHQKHLLQQVHTVSQAATTALDKIKKPLPAVDVSDMKKQLKKLLKLSTFEPEYHYWLDTGFPDLNAVLGSRNKGIAYGRIYEIAGIKHGGKTLITQIIAGMAQKDGAAYGLIDLEHSRDQIWAEKLGVDWDSMLPIYPKLIVQKNGLKRLQSAESMFSEAEAAMSLLADRGFDKQIWVIDSLAMIQTEMVVEAGTEGQNMRTKLDRSAFLSMYLPRLAGLAANYNAMVLIVNQIRTKQGMVFGDPTYTPGGNAKEHACTIQARVKRGEKGGRLLKSGAQIGIFGSIKNIKNKAGEGSIEGETCAFKVRWNTNPAKISFMPVEEAQEESANA